jgi:hypothetical protein
MKNRFAVRMAVTGLTNYLKSNIITKMRSDQRRIAMKPISTFVILVYILIPLVCFSHPDEWRIQPASDVVDIFTSEYPDKQGKDNCESTCFFAEHTLFDYQTVNMLPAFRLRESSLIFSEAQGFIPIFVPPQNKS